MFDRAAQSFGSRFQGACVASEVRPGVTYRVDRAIGGGSMSVAFFALRLAPDGQTPVVLKILRPHILRSTDRAALLAVQKEAVALGRLNERTPPVPFVVRLVDTGTFRVPDGKEEVDLPWLAIEYVHGGPDGTTLEERVSRTLDQTGIAFDPERAAHAIECLAQGLSAIHDVGVIHRDIKPTNVLCCGSGSEEIFKIADFGIARARGMTGTFGAMLMGTPGYAAPEQLLVRNVEASSDIFSLAAVVYYMLTGEDYFSVDYPAAYCRVVEAPSRRRLKEAAALHPELRACPDACAAIDTALAQATAFEGKDRPESARLLAQMIVPSLKQLDSLSIHSTPKLKTISPKSTYHQAYSFSPLRSPDEDHLIRAVAWDGDGRCLTVTSKGLAFWDGIDFRPVFMKDLPDPEGIHFVLRVGAGVWLVGGDGATAALCTSSGSSKLLAGPDPMLRFTLASGDVHDLAVLVGMRPDEPPTLHGLAGGRWIKPASLSRAASVTSLSRLDDRRWLVTGRSQDSEGFAAIYDPLAWEVRRVKTPPCRAYLASATRSEQSLGVIVGASGHTVRFEGQGNEISVIDSHPDLSAVTLDDAGAAWAGSAGALWLQKPESGARWDKVHETPWEAPFISLFATSGRVIAMSVDGGILEGRPTPANVYGRPQ